MQQLAVQTKAKVMIDVMNLMQYDAMAIGNQDLEVGAEILRERIADAKFPVLSANVTLAQGGQLLARPYVLLEVGGHRVGIVGLTGDLGEQALPEVREQYVMLNADEVLVKYVTELSKQADIIIVLSTRRFEEDQRLSSLVPGIDVILGGQSRIPMTDAWRNEQTGTLVYQAGSQGEWIGRRRLHLDSAGAVPEHSDELIYLTTDYADDPEMRAFLDNYKAD